MTCFFNLLESDVNACLFYYQRDNYPIDVRKPIAYIDMDISLDKYR